MPGANRRYPEARALAPTRTALAASIFSAIRRGMVKGSRAEIKCDACDGSGSLPVREPEPGRKIYPGRCTKCAGKGRIPKPE